MPPPIDWPVSSSYSTAPLSASNARKRPVRSAVKTKPPAVGVTPATTGAAANFQRIEAGEFQARVVRLNVLVGEKTHLQFAAATHVRPHPKPHRAGRVKQPRVHLQIGRLDDQIVGRARVAHVAADRDPAGELTACDLADSTMLGSKVVELQHGSLRSLQNNHVLRRRDS